MKTQIQQAPTNAPQTTTAPQATGGTTPPAPPVVAAPIATLAQRIAACVALPALLQLEAEARASAEQGIWLGYLETVSVLHAQVVAARVQAAATKAAADAAMAQAAVDALLQSSILKLVDKFAPMIASAPVLLAQVAPMLETYRAARSGNQSIAAIVNQIASTPMPQTSAPVVPIHNVRRTGS